MNNMHNEYSRLVSLISVEVLCALQQSQSSVTASNNAPKKDTFGDGAMNHVPKPGDGVLLYRMMVVINNDIT